jgi:hypothetical protein
VLIDVDEEVSLLLLNRWSQLLVEELYDLAVIGFFLFAVGKRQIQATQWEADRIFHFGAGETLDQRGG